MNANSQINFQPTILKGVGYTASRAQVLTIPVYVVAFVLSVTCAFLADRFRQRYLFGMLGWGLLVIGLAVALAQPRQPGVRYMGMFFIVSGPYIAMPVTVVWLAFNLGKGYKRIVGLGTLLAIGNCGALISANVFITKGQLLPPCYLCISDSLVALLMITRSFPLTKQQKHLNITQVSV